MSTNKIFEYTAAEIRDHAANYIPDYMIESVMGWVMDGRVPGGFLEAVLKNDLMGAAAAADATNGPKLKDWVIFLHNFTPGGCHGMEQNYREWFEIGGLNGMLKRLQAQAKDATDDYESRDAATADEVRGKI